MKSPATVGVEGSPATPVVLAGNPGLRAENLGKSFKKRPVLRGLSLSVQRGEAVGLLGPNGAGKTTCFYLMTGLMAADYGRVYLDGHDITGLPMYRRARLGLGYLPQEASIFRGLTVENNIRAVLEVSVPARARARARAGRVAGGVLDHSSASHTLARALGRRAPARGDRPCARLETALHAARRAALRHRPHRGGRESAISSPTSRTAASACCSRITM